VALSSADAFAHAQAAALAAARAEAAAYAAAGAYAEAQAAAASGVQAVAEAVAETEAAARACASAEAHAEASAAVGVQAIAEANSQAEAAARACATALAHAEASVAVGVEAIATANAKASASAHAAALAQAEAEAHVAVGVQAAAAAFAKASAAAFAAAEAGALAYAEAYAAAGALAIAEADAYASAQACALAVAGARASATAVSEAYARAFAAAEATASALAQAHVMANAAAQAAAAAYTSVDVVPAIETSVRAVIDPECLQPVCEEYKPCPPCPEYQPCPACDSCCDEPKPDQGCPETQTYGWNFGELAPGMRVNQMKSFPYELTYMVNEMGATSAATIGSNFPAGLTFDLALSAQRGVLSGQVPEKPGTYQISFALYDRNQCFVIELTVYVVVGQPSEPEPEPEQACGKPTSLQWDFGEVEGGTFHFLTARQIPTDIRYQINSAGVIAAELLSSNLPGQAEFNLDLDNHIGTLSGFMPEQAATYQLVFALYDQAECEVIRLNVLLNVAGSTQETPPPTQTERICVDVSAVAIVQTIGTATTYRQQVSEPEAIAVQMVINGQQYYTTPFQICGSQGDTIRIEAEAEFWTHTEQRLPFAAWQKREWDNAEQQWTWVTISQSQFLSIRLEQGGSLRAVYTQSAR